MLRFTSLIVLSGIVSFVLADPGIPYYPNVTDPNFPLGSRCIDYCAFLNPNQICPGHPLDVSCLCEVYNQRLPACQQCWAEKNATVGNDLMDVENFCSSYLATASITTTASGAKATASAASTTTGVTASASSTQSASSTASPSVQTKSGAPASGLGTMGLWVAGFAMVGAVMALL